MPLIIDDIAETTAHKPAAAPTTFHKDLTGNGSGRRGRLNLDVHPGNPDTSYEPVPQTSNPTKEQIDSETTVRTLVTQPLLERALYTAINSVYTAFGDHKAGPADQRLLNIEVPPAIVDRTIGVGASAKNVTSLSMFEITGADALVKGKIGFTPEHRIFLDLEPQLVVLRKRGVLQLNGDTDWTNTTHVRYRAVFYILDPQDATEALIDRDGDPILDSTGAPRTGPSIERIGAVTSIAHQSPLSVPDLRSFALVTYTADVPSMLETMVPQLLGYLYGAGAVVGTRINSGEFEQFSLEHYDLYGRLCNSAEAMCTEKSTEVIGEFIAQVHSMLAGTGDLLVGTELMTALINQLSYLDHFSTVPLEGYSAMHAVLTSLDSGGPFSTKLVNSNVQLKQNAELQHLAAVKADLPVPGPVDPSKWSIDPRYSRQQRNAINTDEPLVMVVAGAGSGKSTVVTERIRRLTLGCGVDPATIQVWSFTNAAADEIRDRNPGIVSKTIARTIHEIYMTNFPEQQLSTMETISNSIRIYYGALATTDPVFQEFLGRIDAMTMPGGESNANIIGLSTFIESHLDAVISILETIKQTTLEFEIILAYLLIENASFYEPNPSPDYLIIDEVQDNSAFQFVYAMRYATKHKCALYLVGDASQTLYEFRAANPKALTALESSGVFEICKLSTNYRSTQEVLDFANIHLAQIEANRFAQIQLDANDLVESTAESFQKSVKMVDVNAHNQKAFNDSVGGYFREPKIKDYIIGNLSRGEVTTVLAFTRNHCKAIATVLADMFPTQHVANLTSDLAFTSNTFSSYIAKYWDEITCVDPRVVAWTFTRQVDAHLPEFETNLAVVRPIIARQLNDWVSESAVTLSLLLGQLDAGVITTEEFFLGVRQSILDYEVGNNHIKASLLKQRNLARKQADAAMNPKLMVSTIHGVKGMEFDNVILVVKPETNTTWADESYRRALYVALTRAKTSELILAGSTTAKPRIAGAYQTVIDALTERDDERALAVSSGADVNEISESDDDSAGHVSLEAAISTQAPDAADLSAIPVITADTSATPTQPVTVAEAAEVVDDELEAIAALGEFVLPDNI